MLSSPPPAGLIEVYGSLVAIINDADTVTKGPLPLIETTAKRDQRLLKRSLFTWLVKPRPQGLLI